MVAALILPAFLAGLVMFLAPCTLPLVPGYLSFISGVSLTDLHDPKRRSVIRQKIFFNGVLYVIGFSVVFISLGSAVGFLGSVLFLAYRSVLARIGAIFIILFGLLMIDGALRFYESRWPVLRTFGIPGAGWLTREHRLNVGASLTPGKPTSSILFGAIFALGWTPCVGPVLGAVLTLAATSTTVGEGTLLLAVFSLGLALPFLVLAAGISYFVDRLPRLLTWLPAISLVGGGLIVLLGILILTDSLGLWVAFFFDALSAIGYQRLYLWL